ncbi:trace amine-associated receptor 9-like [Amphiura filiformis]|uniref:trace amine-associated receptor 9-like n=1 Tax=Amphiura filiformis TaxID=82378 RepID=UPI003B21B732
MVLEGENWTNTSNIGHDQHDQVDMTYQTLLICKAVAVSFTAILGIVINITCLIVLRRMREMNPVTRVFMTSMTVADLGTVVFIASPVIPSTILDRWPFGDAFCTLCSMFNVNFFFASFMCLLNVNLERFLAVSYPFAYPLLVTVNRARMTAVALWFCSIAFSVFCSYMPGREIYFSKTMHTCLTGPLNHDETDIFGTAAFLLFVIIPFVTTLCLFLRLYLVARYHARQIAAQQTGHNTESRKAKAERKTFMTFFIMTMVLSIGYTPLVASTVYENITRISFPAYLVYLAEIMGFANCFMNAIIYYFRNSKFRREARKVLGVLIPLLNAGNEIESLTVGSSGGSTASSTQTVRHR